MWVMYFTVLDSHVGSLDGEIEDAGEAGEAGEAGLDVGPLVTVVAS